MSTLPPTATDAPAANAITSAPGAATAPNAEPAAAGLATFGPSRESPFAIASEQRARAAQRKFDQPPSFQLVQDCLIPCRGYTDGVLDLEDPKPIDEINANAVTRCQRRVDARPKQTPGSHLACVPHAALYDPILVKAKDTVGKIVEFCSVHPTHPFSMIQVVGILKVRRAHPDTFQKFFEYLKYDIHPDFLNSESFFLLHLNDVGVLDVAHMSHCRLLHPDRACYYYGATQAQVDALLPGAKDVVAYTSRTDAVSLAQDADDAAEETEAPPATATKTQAKRGRSAQHQGLDTRRPAQPTPRDRAPSRRRPATSAITASATTASAATAPANAAPAAIAPANAAPAATAPAATAPATTASAATASANAALVATAPANTAAAAVAMAPHDRPAARDPPTSAPPAPGPRERAPLLSAPTDDWSLTERSSGTMLAGSSMLGGFGGSSD